MENKFPTDIYITKSGEPLVFTFFAHATFAMDWQECRIYNDPVAGFLGEVEALPKADGMLIGHHHYDHMEVDAVMALRGEGCTVMCDATTAGMLPEGVATAVAPGDTLAAFGIDIEVLPAYNSTPGHTDFHPQSRGDVGYVLTVGGSRIYIAGDGEPTSDMLALRDIDIAFLPVNQPYTMTEEQASQVLHAIRPRIFYPYHYGQVDHKTDLELLGRLIADLPDTEMRIRPME